MSTPTPVRTLLDDLVFAASIAEAAGTRASADLASRLDQAAQRLREEMDYHDMRKTLRTESGVAFMALEKVNGGKP